MCRNIGKVERAYRTVYQRNAVKQQSAGEERGKDVLGACLAEWWRYLSKATSAAIGMLAVSSPMKNIRKCPAEIMKYIPSSVESVST